MNTSPSHRPTCHNTDLHIDRTLRALNQVNPTPGLQDRLLATLDAGLEARQSPRTTRRRLTLTPKFLTLASATLLLTLSAALSLHLRRHQAPSPLNTSHLAPQQQPAPAAKPQPTPGAPSSPSQTAKAGSPAPIHLEATLQAPPQTPNSPQPTLDEQALADFHAPSQLAPPMPPTDQERLAGLMLRHGEKHDLAALDVTQQAIFAQQERARFQNFFDPPPSEYLQQQIVAAEKLHPSVATLQPNTSAPGDQK